MGRKRIEIDLKKVEECAQLCDSEADIASALGISYDTLARRKQDLAGFADAIKRGRAKAKLFIGGKLMQACREGNLTAAIYLDKRNQWREEFEWRKQQAREQQGQQTGITINIVDDLK